MRWRRAITGTVGIRCWSAAKTMARKKKFDVRKEVRAIARERVGAVPASRAIEPKSERKKPKYRKPITVEDAEGG